ncbi:MAG: N-acetylmuramoyl-L-alanine amidase [Streptosporangiales bacterium]|nr:N-acetylmuramoyl-L-alanine amidase [Streptosporangiales bacterium]
MAATACGGAGPDAGGSPSAAGGSAAATPSPSPTASDSPAASPSPARTAAAQPLRGKVVTIDPGHNGGNASAPEEINRQVPAGNGARKACDTTGTQTNAGYTEHAFAWDVAKRLNKRLRALGATTVLTRKNDKGMGPCVNERAAIGNEAEADAAISIHADGAPASARGFHVIMPGRGSDVTAALAADSRRLGLAVRSAYRSGTRSPYSTYLGRNGLDTRTDLGGLNLSTVPKVFIECGNMRNSAEAARMSSARFRQRAADALADGIATYLR